MIKKYQLKKDPEQDCFLCSKPGISFDKPSLELILTLTVCRHHTEATKTALAKSERQPGEDDE
jgi:hypothetical protein